jgi:DNA adenine methylase
MTKKLGSPICVIPCSQSKIDKSKFPAKAADVYTGQLTKAAMAYAEKFHSGNWFILSAKHGFLKPGDIIREDYDVSFYENNGYNTITDKDLSVSASRKMDCPSKVIVLAGKLYANKCREVFKDSVIETPLDDCEGIGFMLQKLNQAVESGTQLGITKSGISASDFHYYFAMWPSDWTPLVEKVLAKEDILISFNHLSKRADPNGKLLDRVKNHPGRVMLDSGAFANFSSPGKVSFDEWLEFVKEYQGLFSELIMFDDLRSRKKTLSSFEAAKSAGINPLFVDHLFMKTEMEKVNSIWRKEAKVAVSGFGKTLPGNDIVPTSFKFENAIKKAHEADTHIHLLAIGSFKKFLPYFSRINSVDSAAWAKASAFGEFKAFVTKEIAGFKVPILRSFNRPGSGVSSKQPPKEVLEATWNVPARKYGLGKSGCTQRPGAYSHVVSAWNVARYLKALRQFDFPEFEKQFKEDENKAIKKFFDMAEDNRIVKRDTAPVNPSGEGKKSAIKFEKVTSDLKPITLRSPVVSLTGSVVNQGETKNDVDILIHGPLNEATRRAIQFRLGRMFPPDISQRIQFLDESMGGPITDHASLYDLVLKPRDKIEIVRMELDKVEDDFSLWPKDRGKVRGVVQQHSRGKSQHLDLRFQVDPEFLIGWTLFAGREDVSPDVNTVAQARAVYQGYSLADGNKALKPLLSPAKMQGTKKLRQPIPWLTIDDRVFEPGTVGATSEEEGVMIKVASPDVQWGMQQQEFHEYFLTGDKTWTGPLYFRFVVLDDTDQKNPKVWLSHMSREALPSVLKKRTVDKGKMPPLGQSAMPKSLEDETPKEFRFWEADSEKDARRIRDDLVASNYFNSDNVKIIDGEFRKVIKKYYVDCDLEKRVPRRAIFASPGGKSGLADMLAGMMPRHTTYVEPFFGSGAVFFTKELADKNVANDCNSDLMEFYRLAKTITSDDLAKLRKMNWVCNIDLYKKLRNEKPTTKLRKIYKFLYVRVNSYMSKDGYNHHLDGRDRSGFVDRIEKHLNKLKKLSILNKDYEEVISKYDSSDTLFFMDPPYVRKVEGVSTHVGLGDKTFDEDRLVKACKSIKGKFILTCSTNIKSQLNEAGFNVKTVSTDRVFSMARGTSDKKKLKQLLVTNFEVNKENSQSELEDTSSDKIDVENVIFKTLPIFKTKEEQFILAVVLEPNDGEGEAPLDPDSQLDIYSRNEIRTAAHTWLGKYRNIGLQHSKLINKKVLVVESYISPCDFAVTPDGEFLDPSKADPKKGIQLVREGTWLLGLKIVDKKLWVKVRDGEIDGLSIGGSARRIPATTS